MSTATLDRPETTDTPVGTPTNIGIRDMLDARKWYNPRTLEELTGIPAGITRDAQRQFKGTIFSQYRGDDRTLMLGSAILVWIRQEQIPWTPTDWARDIHARRLRANAPLAAPEPDLLDLAREKIAVKKLAAEKAEAAEADAAIGRYVEILRRFGSPEEGDVDTLADAIERFSLTDQKVRADREVVRKIDRLSTRLDSTRLEPDRKRIRKSAHDIARRSGWLFQPVAGKNEFPKFRGSND